MLKALAVTALALGTLALGACTKRGANAPGDEQVTIVVDNQNFYDATVYLRWHSDRRRLGNVVGFTKKEFQTRWVGPDVLVEVDLLAGGTYRGDRIAVNPGEVLEVELPPNLDRIRSRIGGSFPTMTR